MMAQLVDHFLTGLTLADGEHCTLRRKQEHRLTQLLAELVDTERKYVDDLETVCQEYLPLAGETRERYCRSLDRRRKRLARHGSHTQSWPAGSRPRPMGEVHSNYQHPLDMIFQISQINAMTKKMMVMAMLNIIITFCSRCKALFNAKEKIFLKTSRSRCKQLPPLGKLISPSLSRRKRCGRCLGTSRTCGTSTEG